MSGVRCWTGRACQPPRCPPSHVRASRAQFVSPEEFDTVHFFGDKTQEGGGDYELFCSERTVGHTVTDAADTLRQVEALLLS